MNHFSSELLLELILFLKKAFIILVADTVVSRLTEVSNIVALTDGSVVIAGMDVNGNKLKLFNMIDNTTICTEELTYLSGGLAETSLRGIPALAISYR